MTSPFAVLIWLCDRSGRQARLLPWFSFSFSYSFRHKTGAKTPSDDYCNIWPWVIFNSPEGERKQSCGLLWAGNPKAAVSRRKAIEKGAHYCERPITPPVGLEPTTLRLTAACSTDWAKEEYSIFKKFAFWICLSYPNSIIWFPVCYRTVRSTDWAKEEYLIYNYIIYVIECICQYIF